jgi:predicted ArsR family transcriptional regulator
MKRLDALGNPELRAAFLYARAQPRPVSADDLAAAQKVHRNVARARLERLAAARLLIPSFERRTGRTGPGAGRPAKLYRVAPELSAIEFPEHRYEQLVGALIDAIAAHEPGRLLEEAGTSFARTLARQASLRAARRLDSGVARLCAALGQLGYQAGVAEATDEGASITSATCPLRPLVRARPELAELDRAMWAGLVAQAVEGVETGAVACRTRGCHDDASDCRIEIRLGGVQARPETVASLPDS